VTLIGLFWVQGALGIVLTPFADWLQSLLSNIVSGTLTAPFIALTWTLLYYRLRAAKEAPAEAPQPAA
jgi:urea transporter